jgi:hypothetical protein
MTTRVRAVRSWGEYGEFRRLTLRGEPRSTVLVARARALTCSNSRNHRRQRLLLAYEVERLAAPHSATLPQMCPEFIEFGLAAESYLEQFRARDRQGRAE